MGKKGKKKGKKGKKKGKKKKKMGLGTKLLIGGAVAAIAIGGLYLAHKHHKKSKERRRLQQQQYASTGRSAIGHDDLSREEIPDSLLPYASSLSSAKYMNSMETIAIPDAITIGLGWEGSYQNCHTNMDLLASVYNHQGQNLGYLGGWNSNNRSLFNNAIYHTGDDVSGGADSRMSNLLGDNENIVFDLARVPPETTTIVFGVTLVTNAPVQQAYCHMLPMLREEAVKNDVSRPGTRGYTEDLGDDEDSDSDDSDSDSDSDSKKKKHHTGDGTRGIHDDDSDSDSDKDKKKKKKKDKKDKKKKSPRNKATSSSHQHRGDGTRGLTDTGVAQDYVSSSRHEFLTLFMADLDQYPDFISRKGFIAGKIVRATNGQWYFTPLRQVVNIDPSAGLWAHMEAFARGDANVSCQNPYQSYNQMSSFNNNPYGQSTSYSASGNYNYNSTNNIQQQQQQQPSALHLFPHTGTTTTTSPAPSDQPHKPVYSFN